MKKYLEYLIYCLLLIVSLLYLKQNTRLNRINKESALKDNRYIELKDYKKQTLDLLVNTYGIQIQSDGIQIEKDIRIQSLEGDSIYLSQLFENEYKFVFCYSELNCSTCIEKEFDNLKKYSNEIGVNNIIILAQYSNIRDLAVFIRVNDIKSPVYKINNNKLGLLIDKYDSPYLFVTNRNMIANQIFIPLKEIPNLSEMYYEIIITRYFKAN